MNIAITGEGIISAIGHDKATVLESLREGRSGIGEMRYLPSSHHELPVGEVKWSDEELRSQLSLDPSAKVSRTTMMGIYAVRQALEDSALLPSDGILSPLTSHLSPLTSHHSPLKIILISGTTVAGMDLSERYFAEMINSGGHLEYLLDHSCGDCTRHIAEHFGIFTDYTTISTACSSAANALILGANLLKAGEADVVVAGGTEALSLFHLNGFNSLMILDKEHCRPFDDQRAGLNLGEGAAYVVMETEEHARKRQAPVHAYLTGYGNACDAFHQTASSDNGVFGSHLPPVSSTKGFTGHTTSASGSIETVICLLSMHHGFIPANLGFAHPMASGIIPSLGAEGCTLRHVLCNSFGFGGNDSSLLLEVSGEKLEVRDYSQDIQLPHDISLTSHLSPLTSISIRELARVEITSEDQLSEIREFVKPMEARRMGKLMKASLLSSLKALKQAGVDRPDAIITGTALGCWENSEALLLQIKEEGEVMLSPTNFMQSTHNTISSNIAIRLGCHGYNVTYTQGSDSLEWALRDARLLLASGRYKTVLVGCHDETTFLYRSLMERLGITGLPAIHSVAIVLRNEK